MEATPSFGGIERPGLALGMDADIGFQPRRFVESGL